MHHVVYYFRSMRTKNSLWAILISLRWKSTHKTFIAARLFFPWCFEVSNPQNSTAQNLAQLFSRIPLMQNSFTNGHSFFIKKRSTTVGIKIFSRLLNWRFLIFCAGKKVRKIDIVLSRAQTSGNFSKNICSQFPQLWHISSGINKNSHRTKLFI